MTVLRRGRFSTGPAGAGGVAGAPGIPQAAAAFSPAKGITTGYAEAVDA